jgi:hypothetical protein
MEKGYCKSNAVTTYSYQSLIKGADKLHINTSVIGRIFILAPLISKPLFCMRGKVSFILALVCISCNQPTAPSTIPAVDSTELAIAALMNISYERVMGKFAVTEFDTMAIFSPEQAEDGGYTSFGGVPLDSLEIRTLFPGKAWASNGRPCFYAVGSFEIDSSHTALLTRVPSDSGSAAISLQVYNNSKRTMADYGILADKHGSEGHLQEKKAWLFKTAEQQLQSFVWVRDYDVPGAPAPQLSDRYSLLDFINDRWDTVTTNSAVLTKDFGNTLKRSGMGAP